MIRARFKANLDDFRSINWPVKYPYWCSGYTDTHSIVVAYATNEEEIYKNWPEAEDLEYVTVEKPIFSDRFPKPEWYVEEVTDEQG